MLPLFTPDSAVTNLSRIALSEDEYRGSNLELVVGLVRRVLARVAEVIHDEGHDLVVDDDESSRRHKASQLFLNEVDQLQTQMRHLINVAPRRSCCASVLA